MRIIQTVILATALVLLSASCSSVPLPGSPTESLFILTGDVDRHLIDRQSEPYQVSQIQMTLVNRETGFEKEFFYYPGNDFIAIPLEPGRYNMHYRLKIGFKHPGGGEWEDEKTINSATYLIEKNVVYVSNSVLTLEKKNIGEGAYYRLGFGFHEDSVEIKDRAMKEMMKERRYKAWDLYPVIGWESPEEDSF